MNQRRSGKRRSTAPQTQAASSAATESPAGGAAANPPVSSAQWWREAIESIVVAIILALLFRAFEAEAFVIPTGSMAPTLQGRHKDLECDQCGYRYRTGDSFDASAPDVTRVFGTTCPMCRYRTDIDSGNLDHTSFTGDRILVNKFLYEISEPQRWDVFVFKYPGNAKQNYIKRLVGLPGETLKIHHGDVLVRRDDDTAFRIARKPPHKVLAMLQPVHDTGYVPQKLIDMQWPWPGRWRPAPADVEAAGGWEVLDGGRRYRAAGGEGPPQWLYYHHTPLSNGDWNNLLTNDELPQGVEQRTGQLITDYYAYNASAKSALSDVSARDLGLHWVGDLALECRIDVQAGAGAVLLELVEGGSRFNCRIDPADGSATLSILGDERVFFDRDDAGRPIVQRKGKTKLTGPGQYKLRFANVDDQLMLWVDNRLAEFAETTTYVAPADVQPRYNGSGEPGDLAPARIGSEGLPLETTDVRVLRDVYYLAVNRGPHPWDPRPTSDYQWELVDFQGQAIPPGELVRQVMSRPDLWKATGLFDSRRDVSFTLERFPDDPQRDQFFPMGDNSPQSSDGRMWPGNKYVERRLLAGKAFFIYWPHPWYVKTPDGRTGVPVLPNFGQMGWVR